MNVVSTTQHSLALKFKGLIGIPLETGLLMEGVGLVRHVRNENLAGT
jgi:hypothetical protein